MENKLTTPLAIIFAGILIAGAVFLTGSDNKVALEDNPKEAAAVAESGSGLEAVTPVSADDHILGSKDAKIFIIEYSDTECPYCHMFHTTMRQIMDEYEEGEKVAWVYRHFPLTQMHPKAFKEAVATECAAELGGNDKFWQYTNRLYEIASTDNSSDESKLSDIAQYVGLDVGAFNTCLESGKYDKKIQNDAENAQATGARGTPWSVVVSAEGDKEPIPGASPYEAVKAVIDEMLVD